MLPKKNRITKAEIDTIFKKGVFLGVPNLSLKYYINKGQKYPQSTFVVSKKVEKLATSRNSLKRKGYLAVRELPRPLPAGFMGVFTIKKADLTKQQIKEEIEKILNKIN